MKCPNCERQMAQRGYSHVTKVGGFTVTDGTGMVPFCAECGGASLSSADLSGYEMRAARLILTGSKEVSGEVLKFARKALGLRQKDLASVLRCNEQHLSRLEGAEKLDMNLRLAVAMLLDIALTGGTPSEVGSSGEHKLEIRKAS